MWQGRLSHIHVAEEGRAPMQSLKVANLTARDVPLNHLVGGRFRVGGVLLEGGRLNIPCRYLELVVGKTVGDLSEHRSGLNCRTIEGGEIAVGDGISLA